MDIENLDRKLAKLSDPIAYHFENNLHFLVMNSKENSFDPTTISQVHKVLDKIEAAPDSEPGTLVTISTSPKIFSTGFNLEYLKNEKAHIYEMMSSFSELSDRLLTFPMATVAVVNGHAFAGGLLFSLLHDFRIMNA